MPPMHSSAPEPAPQLCSRHDPPRTCWRFLLDVPAQCILFPGLVYFTAVIRRWPTATTM